ncbi:MAG: glycosyltransferase family 39 protein [bacterium]|nr:glycosyltransferase family 39 protein [bacterium]
MLCGPGYGLILAVLKLIFGTHLIWPVLFNILMGGLAPVFIYLLSFQLFNSRAVAVVAGLFSALSLTSVALSSQLLTDQPYFTIQVASLYYFVAGCQQNRRWLLLLSGLLAGYGALVQPMGQIWPVVVFALLIVLPWPAIYSSRRQLWKSSGIALAVMLIIVGSWTARNYAIHDLPVFGSNGMRALRSFLVAQSVAKSDGDMKLIPKSWDSWEIEDGNFLEDQKGAYANARQRVVDEFRAHPSQMISLYWQNLFENMTTANAYVER